MSYDFYVFLRRDRMPAPDAWSAAVRDKGFDLEFGVEFDPYQFEGYLPCKYQSKECGFEFFAEDADLAEMHEEEVISADEVRQLGDRDFLVTLAVRSDPRDAVAASVAAGVLAAMSDGIIAEDGLPPFILPSDALNWAKECERSFAEQENET